MKGIYIIIMANLLALNACGEVEPAVEGEELVTQTDIESVLQDEYNFRDTFQRSVSSE